MSNSELPATAVDQVKVRVLPDGRLSRKDAAKYLGRAEKTLAMWGMVGQGPRSVKVGGRRFYFKDDLDAFVRGDYAANTAGAPGPEAAQP